MTHPRPTVPYPNSFVSEQVDAVKMAESIKRAFVSQVFTVGQKAAVEYCGNNFLVTVNSMLVEGAPDGVRNSRGLMIPDTGLVFEAAHNSAIKITNQKVTTVNSSLFRLRNFRSRSSASAGWTRSSKTSSDERFHPGCFPRA